MSDALDLNALELQGCLRRLDSLAVEASGVTSELHTALNKVFSQAHAALNKVFGQARGELAEALRMSDSAEWAELLESVKTLHGSKERLNELTSIAQRNQQERQALLAQLSDIKCAIASAVGPVGEAGWPALMSSLAALREDRDRLLAMAKGMGRFQGELLAYPGERIRWDDGVARLTHDFMLFIASREGVEGAGSNAYSAWLTAAVCEVLEQNSENARLASRLAAAERELGRCLTELREIVRTISEDA